MAEMKIIIQKIEKIEPHDNADKLSIAFTDIFDWPVIIGKDNFKIGDKVIHFPVDCVIPQNVEEILLGDSKIKLKNGRIRAAKIRGIISYGILASVEIFQKYRTFDEKKTDLMKYFGCEKYEPPQKKQSNKVGSSGKKSWKRTNRNFTKYFDMNHLQNCKGVFEDNDMVAVTEKLHGSSFRAGWVKRDAVTFWEKLKLWIGKLWNKDYEWEFVYGSRNVQLQGKMNRKNKKTFYESNIYAKMVKKYNLKKLPKNTVIYGEIVGPGIQKNYQYTEDHEMFIYDIKINGLYINGKYMRSIMDHFDLRPVPLFRVGYWKNIKKDIGEFWKYNSWLDPNQKVIEGVVIETTEQEICKHGRKKVKVLNPEYLLNKTNTDFH